MFLVVLGEVLVVVPISLYVHRVELITLIRLALSSHPRSFEVNIVDPPFLDAK